METLTINIDNSLAKGKALLLYLKAIANETNSFITIEPEIFETKKEHNLLLQIEDENKEIKNHENEDERTLRNFYKKY